MSERVLNSRLSNETQFFLDLLTLLRNCKHLDRFLEFLVVKNDNPILQRIMSLFGESQTMSDKALEFLVV